MESVSRWLTGVVAAGCLIRLVRMLNVKGALCRVAEFTGGLVLLGALLQPMGTLVLDAETAADWESLVEERVQELEQEGEERLCSVIEQQLGAYISDKEPSLSAEVIAEVENGVVTVKEVDLTGPYSETVSQWIASELGAERQVWHDGET